MFHLPFYFPKKSHGTKEISIEVIFNIPDTFKEKGKVVWKKKWRTNGYTDEKIETIDRKDLSNRSRIPGTLKRIRYRYVPAVKSKEYYKSLLSDLYFTVSSVLDSPLEESVNSFSSVLQDYTKQISDEVGERIGIGSRLSVPENLSELFKILEFETSILGIEASVSLIRRGDGIQARHIPIILKYIADEDQKTRNQGSVKVSTIWGFEEPENGVELSRAFEMAKDFKEYSSDIQMFITTHSPAFYLEKNNEYQQIVFAIQGEKNDGTKLKDNFDSERVGEYMGLMPIVAPYVAKQEEIIANSKKMLQENLITDVQTVFVEGKTDKVYLELAIKLYSQALNTQLKNGKLRIFTKNEEAGCKKVIDWAYTWIFSGHKCKAVALFDRDEAGKIAKRELTDSEIYKNKNSNSLLKVMELQPSDEIKELFQDKINILFEAEHLFSFACWKELKKKNWVEIRSPEELSYLVEKHMQIDKTIIELLDEKVKNKEALETIVRYNPKDNKKNQICNYIKDLDITKQEEFLKGFKNTVIKLEDYFA